MCRASTLGDLAREGSPSLIDSLTDQAGSVSINADARRSRSSPTCCYRGFEASPVLGTPQGIAVYQNGVRINEAFGDTVNWDLIPDIAIDRIDIVSSNPVYGLNALGGAAVVTMKNGFTYQGFESELAGGSFGQRGGDVPIRQAGRRLRRLCRRHASSTRTAGGSSRPTSVQQLYADLGARGERGLARHQLHRRQQPPDGEGTTPGAGARGQPLARSSPTPQNNTNQLEFVTLNGSYQATDALSFQANAYRREFHQTVSTATPPTTPPARRATACCASRTARRRWSARPAATIPDLSNGGTVPIGENDTRDDPRGQRSAARCRRPIPARCSATTTISCSAAASTIPTSISNRRRRSASINPSLQVLHSGLFRRHAGEHRLQRDAGQPQRDQRSITASSLTDTFNVTPALARHRERPLQPRRDRLCRPARLEPHRQQPLRPLQPGDRRDLQAPRQPDRLCRLFRRQPRADAERDRMLEPGAALPAAVVAVVRPAESEAGGLAHLRGGAARQLHAADAAARQVHLEFRAVPHRSRPTTSTASRPRSAPGFFENIGATRRQGIETGLAYKDDDWSVYATYSLVDATFQSPLTLPSPNNPFADANGNIQVAPGDRLPGIPAAPAQGRRRLPR